MQFNSVKMKFTDNATVSSFTLVVTLVEKMTAGPLEKCWDLTGQVGFSVTASPSL